VPSLKHFLIRKKDVLEDVLESSEIVEELTEKLLLKQAAGKNFRLCYKVNIISVSFLLFYIYNCCVFDVKIFHYSDYNFIMCTMSVCQDFTVVGVVLVIFSK